MASRFQVPAQGSDRRARKAAKAPDATKIRLIADQIAAIPMPDSMATEEGRQALAVVEGWRLAVTSKIRELATTL